MFKLSGRIRKANRGPIKPSETSTSSVDAPLYQGTAESSVVVVSKDVASQSSLSEPGTGAKGNTEWLGQITKRPLDTNFLIPTFLSEEVKVALKAEVQSIYRPLKPWQTRLLVLKAGKSGSPMCCSLVEADVIDGNGLGLAETSEVVSYEALSYAWGDPTPVCSITCNQAPFAIALELATALHYLRSSTMDRYIWCDAICINQRDIAEKSLQVKNMLRIFEKADVVVAWLGKHCSSTGRLFDALELVNDHSRPFRAAEYDEELRSVLEDIITSLNSHLESAWFVRTWVRQEVFAAKKLVVQLGPYKLGFETFIEKLYHFRRVLNAPGSSVGKIVPPSTLNVYQDDYQHRGMDRLNFVRDTKLPSYVEYWLHVLRSGALFKVSDERDRIYGALGLLTSVSVKFFARLPAPPESLAAGFPIDYNKDLSEVYQDVTKYLINTSKTLQIMDVFRDRRDLQTRGLVSWATDWSRDTEEYGLFDRDYEYRNQFVDLLKQDYSNVGKLRLAGVRVASRLAWLDAKKEILHPRDRFMPKYRRSVTLQDIMKGPTRRTHSGLASEIQNPTYSIIFTSIEEGKESSEMRHVIHKPDFDPPFASFLSGSNYVFAYVEDFTESSFLGLGDLHLLVPRNASLDDIVVSFYGSQCLHLLRPLPGNSQEHQYLGPIAGIACGQEQTLKFTPKNKLGFRTLPKSFTAQETFVLT